MIEQGIKKANNLTTATSTIAGAAGGGAIGYAATMTSAGVCAKLAIAIGIMSVPIAPIAIGAAGGAALLYGLSKVQRKTTSLESNLTRTAIQQGFVDGPQ